MTQKLKPIVKLLDAASLDLNAAARLLVDPQILGAIRLDRGLLNTKDHDLVILIDDRPGSEPRPLPAGDPWRERFRPLARLSAYATTFRYSLSPVPKIDDLHEMLATLTRVGPT
ncbi:MAG: hypothetical protein E6J91_11890 [Deltaproteobacteria bacterium]|nr:MAG: hypothetical protein E6J91_11890 [Deltaproteobacteria bacterium]